MEGKGFDLDELINDVQRFFYEDDAFAGAFERFANDNCGIIDNSSEEMKLEYTDLCEQA